MGNDWKNTTLDDVCIKITDGAHKSPKSVEFGKPMASVKDLEFYGLNLETARHISEEDYFDLVKQGCKPELGDVLIAKDGNSALDTVCNFEEDAEVVLLSSVAILRPNPEKINSRFLKYYFLSSQTIEYLKRNFISGAAIPRVVLRDFKKAEILLPLIPEQKAIAHILGSLDDKIELNRQMNETLEAMAQALFKSWFVDFDPVIDNALASGNAIPDELLERAEQRKAVEKKDNSDIQALFPDEFEFTEEMDWIPKGWDVDSVENLIQINPRVTLKKGTVAPHADMKALPESGYSIDGVVHKAYSGGTKFQNRDVLFARITPCLENGKTGVVDFLKPKEVGFGSTEFIVLREKEDIKMEFVACLARNSKFRLHAQQSMVGSSGRQRVQNACFSSFYLALPRDNGRILKLFNEITAVNFEKISILADECQTVAKLRDTLLPKLMSGEIRIPDATAMVEVA